MWSASLRSHTKEISTRYKTGWNVTKCLACHAKPQLSKRRGFAASPIETATCLENQRLETRHVGTAKRAFRGRFPPILTLSTRYQTGWNVTKCHTCHAKPHDNLLENLRKGEVLQLPPWTQQGNRKTKDSRRDTWAQQNEHFVGDFLQF